MASLNPDVLGKVNGAILKAKPKQQNSEASSEKMAQKLGERPGALASEFASATADCMKSSREYVKEHPFKSAQGLN